jgi:hypothetical protein
MHLTPQDTMCRDRAVEAKRNPDAASAGAPESEEADIEVTPEMIEAGAVLLLGFHLEGSDEDQVVEEIYRIMRRLESNPRRFGERTLDGV